VEPVVPATVVTIDRVVYYRHFDFNLEYPPNLTYIMFGEGDEAFLNHYQTREPDFDEVIALKRAPKWVPPSLLEAGLHVNFPNMPSSRIPKHSPIKPGERRVHYGQKPVREIEVDRSIWFSTKVLNVEDPNNPKGKTPYPGPTPK
jgi:hypothetical protein